MHIGNNYHKTAVTWHNQDFEKDKILMIFLWLDGQMSIYYILPKMVISGDHI